MLCITHGQTPTILQPVVQHVCLFVRLVEFDTLLLFDISFL